MTDTLDSVPPAPGDVPPGAPPLTIRAATEASASGDAAMPAAGRAAHFERRAARPAARSSAHTARRVEPASGVATIEVHIDEGDPLIDFLQSAPGTSEIAALPQFSPAVQRMRDQGVRLVVPMVSGGELVGLIALGARRSERSYSRADRRLLDQLAGTAAPAIRLGQLMKAQEAEARERERFDQELHIAQLIQQQFLPAELPELGGWHVAAFYRPARTVGGDFYDVIELGDGLVMVVAGDVTDKGVPAALVMASTHALLRSAAAASPGEVLRRVNNLLIPQIPLNMFVTCLALVIDLETGRTRFANAGHNLPFVRRGDAVLTLDARGMPLGLMPDSEYDEIETVLEPDDIVMLYSDGITEQHDANGDMFGFERTEALVAAATGGDDLVDRSIAGLAAFQGTALQEDDITIVTLHRGRRSEYQDAVTFAVASDIGNEREVMDRVTRIVGDALPEIRVDALKTAVSETAMNAIEHGNHAISSLPVEVSVRCGIESVTVEIADFGRGPAHEPVEPDLDEKLSGRQTPRGWGLFLVEHLVDRVEDFRDGERHVVRLTMRPDDPAAGATGDTERTPR
ncbi:ATP-binding SpoIIE family protein phosphatase [Microbacterium sp. ASV49]|uniref:SpoIIE family protein phosphatase n=1 Tax=Microbacterium candidum TaxID=3041922 RepID=A0ABT7N2D3_9MICO|nr:SpoIIE family protein phosphatase [Microbacterium sp. ASV49]MDL9980864.1 SpoIIE family protein phosphatase [Microbacterium sp. ASV49]